MNPDITPDPDEAAAEFERSLESLVLSSFAEGVPVEGTWSFDVPVADAPDWTVTIERCDSEGPDSSRQRLLEE